MSKIFTHAAFEARRVAKQMQTSALRAAVDDVVDHARRMWPLAEKMEESRRFHMAEAVRHTVAAYVERFGRVDGLEMWDGQREEILSQPLIPEKDWA